MRIISVIWLFFFCLIFAQEQSLLYRVRDSINSIKPFKVEFIQQVFVDDELEIEESGEILFKNSKILKWTYTNPEYKVFLLLDNEYRFYDKENNQLTKGKISEKNQQWIWQLLFSDEISPFIKCDESQRKIFIRNKEEDMDFVIQINKDSLMERVIQHDSSGAKYIYFFKKYKKKVKISQKDFELELPSDVDIIDEHLD